MLKVDADIAAKNLWDLSNCKSTMGSFTFEDPKTCGSDDVLCKQCIAHALHCVSAFLILYARVFQVWDNEVLFLRLEARKNVTRTPVTQRISSILSSDVSYEPNKARWALFSRKPTLVPDEGKAISSDREGQKSNDNSLADSVFKTV